MDYLVVAWVAIIAFIFVMYVILDGFTLGAGIVFPFVPEQHKDLVISSILPTWDGNQTWLVLGGASLYGAFPLAFSIILPIFYLPILVMVVSLLFRGVSFEFRLKATAGKHRWDLLFTIGSVAAAFIQGVMLGAFIQGFNLTVNDEFQWLTPFTIMTGISLVLGYALLGATRLIYKTVDELKAKMAKVGIYASIGVAICILIVTIWTPYVNSLVATRWSTPMTAFYLCGLPVITIIAFAVLWGALAKHHDWLPYWSSVVIFLTGYLGFAFSLWPYIVPNTITIEQAAAPDSSLKFLLIGASIMIPVLLVYTGYAYQIFKGKVTDAIHY
ncbi:MAG: cytochrome d ubiquinol oxidase subunit II [Gammaproteobacteria bacterium]|nr:cytochrome d ubiquinol oxidase subunit II [Gammaproteobacteria bacterium]